jgi:hypothetical protein
MNLKRGLARTTPDEGGGRPSDRWLEAPDIHGRLRCPAQYRTLCEHVPHLLAERELIDLSFDRRLLAAKQASHKPTVAYLSCVRRELKGSRRYHVERNSQ